MIKEHEETQTVRVKKRYCDVCGQEINRQLSCSEIHCSICKRDLCDFCVGHEDESWGDYRSGYCLSCWYIGIPYRRKIRELQRKIDDLELQWRDAALTAVNTK